jgi:hypothetical protein
MLVTPSTESVLRSVECLMFAWWTVGGGYKTVFEHVGQNIKILYLRVIWRRSVGWVVSGS